MAFRHSEVFAEYQRVIYLGRGNVKPSPEPLLQSISQRALLANKEKPLKSLKPLKPHIDILSPRRKLMQNIRQLDVDILCNDPGFQESNTVSEEDDHPPDQAGE